MHYIKIIYILSLLIGGKLLKERNRILLCTDCRNLPACCSVSADLKAFESALLIIVGHRFGPDEGLALSNNFCHKSTWMLPFQNIVDLRKCHYNGWNQPEVAERGRGAQRVCKVEKGCSTTTIAGNDRARQELSVKSR